MAYAHSTYTRFTFIHDFEITADAPCTAILGKKHQGVIRQAQGRKFTTATTAIAVVPLPIAAMPLNLEDFHGKELPCPF